MIQKYLRKVKDIFSKLRFEEKYRKFQQTKAGKKVEHYQAVFRSKSFETQGIILISVFGVLFALFILLRSPSSAGGGEHGHEEGEEGGAESVEIAQEGLDQSGVKIEKASPVKLAQSIKLRGNISVNRDRFSRITGRASGTVKSIFKNLGDQVKKGEVLATIETSVNRATIDIRSGLDGIVSKKAAVKGGFFPEREMLFEIADLSTVWAEFFAPDIDISRIKKDQTIQIQNPNTKENITAKVSYVSPIVSLDTQSFLIRATLDNTKKEWLPGSFVEGDIVTEEKDAAVVVSRNALQTFEDNQVVFVRDGDVFQARIVRTGLNSLEKIEILEGVEAGEEYASENSFIVKAELLKNSAGHEH